MLTKEAGQSAEKEQNQLVKLRILTKTIRRNFSNPKPWRVSGSVSIMISISSSKLAAVLQKVRVKLCALDHQSDII